MSALPGPGRWRPLQTLLLLASLMVLPLALLLFAQWPLRDWVQAGSMLANDTAHHSYEIYRQYLDGLVLSSSEQDVALTVPTKLTPAPAPAASHAETPAAAGAPSA